MRVFDAYLESFQICFDRFLISEIGAKNPKKKFALYGKKPYSCVCVGVCERMRVGVHLRISKKIQKKKFLCNLESFQISKLFGNLIQKAYACTYLCCGLVCGYRDWETDRKSVV